MLKCVFFESLKKRAKLIAVVLKKFVNALRIYTGRNKKLFGESMENKINWYF